MERFLNFFKTLLSAIKQTKKEGTADSEVQNTVHIGFIQICINCNNSTNKHSLTLL